MKGASPNISVSSGLAYGGEVPLIRDSVWSGPRSFTHFLIENGADVNIQVDGVPYIVTIMRKRVGSNSAALYDSELIRAFIDAGADIHVKNQAGKSAFDYASESKDTELRALFGLEPSNGVEKSGNRLPKSPSGEG